MKILKALMLKALVWIVLLIPINLFSKAPEKKSDWFYEIREDAFTDEKHHIALTYNSYNTFGIYHIEPESYSWFIDIDGINCKSKSKSPIQVLFRVDKNEVVSVYMVPKDDYRGELIWDINNKKNDELLLLMYPFELAEGNIVRMRINDDKCNYQKDLEFSLHGFKKIYKPIFQSGLNQIGNMMEKKNN